MDDERTSVTVSGMSRVQWIRDPEAGELLFVDLKSVQPEEGLAALEAFKLNLQGRPADSVMVLMDVTNAAYNASVSARWKAARLDSASVVRSFAIYGSSGMIAIAVRGLSEVMRLMGLRRADDHKICKSRQEAVAWLRQRQQAARPGR